MNVVDDVDDVCSTCSSSWVQTKLWPRFGWGNNAEIQPWPTDVRELLAGRHWDGKTHRPLSNRTNIQPPEDSLTKFRWKGPDQTTRDLNRNIFQQNLSQI